MSQKLTKQKSSKKSEAQKPAKQDSKPTATKGKPKQAAKQKKGTKRNDTSQYKKFTEEEAELPSDEEEYEDSESEEDSDDNQDDASDLIASEADIQREREEAIELEKLENKQQKASRRRKKLKAENEGVDSEDIQIINEYQPQKRRRLIQEPDSDDGNQPIANQDQSSDEEFGRKAKKHHQIKNYYADEQDDEESEQEGSEVYDEADEANNHENFLSKSRSHHEDKLAFDEVFGHQDDMKIAELDIPERLQIKIGTNRMNPTLEQLQQESEWIFKNILEELRYNRNPNHYEDIKFKILQVLKKILCQYGDIPWICRYAREFYMPELEQKDVWRIYQLDIEYGKLQTQKQKIIEFFEGLEDFAIDNDLKQETFAHYKNRIQSTESLRELNGYQSLMSFYRSYYQKEIEQKVYRESNQSNNGQKAPVPRRDFIFLSRQRKLDEFSKRCMLAPVSLAFNIQADKSVHTPNQPQNIDPLEMAREYQGNEPMKAVKDMCQYTATEIMSLPEVRLGYKKFVYQWGILRTEPTQKGTKELDVCHPCYRVKRVNKRLSELMKTDLFLEILENEAQGLIKFTIKVENTKEDDEQLGIQPKENKNNISCPYFQGIFEKFVPSNDTSKWFIPRREVFGILSGDFGSANGAKGTFSQSIIDEIILELKEDAENFVIQQCTKKYQDLIQKSYYKVDRKDNFQPDDDKIPQRARYNVMGACITQIDARNYQVTMAAVDQYGEFEASQDFQSIIPPRESRSDKMRPGEQEDRQKHAYDKQIFNDLLRQHQIDLIVVLADCLEARKLKSALTDLVQKFLGDDQDYSKDIQVIWGRPEVPKLFSDSNNSMKLLKGQVNNLKKVVCLARFEQDPMNEVLNLWSPIIKENQALNLQFHPLQKQVNQVKLLESFEDINVQTVNDVGIDINLLVEHEHYHNQLQFLSGLGPRKALRYIQTLKAIRRPIYNREMIEKENILGKKCFGCSAGFTKVRVPADRRQSINSKVQYEIYSIDQTRIHPRFYDTVYDIFADLKEYDQSKEQDSIDDKKQKGFQIVEKIIAKPKKLAEIAKTDFVGDIIKKLDKPGLSDLVRQVLDDLMQPFMDFREREDIQRNPENPDDQEKYNNITGPTPNRLLPKELFYYLIDETEKTFKAGMIVQATVIRTYQSQMQDQNGKLLCRLDNGLDAYVHEADADHTEWQNLKRDCEGRVITGRIVQFSRKSGEEDTYKSFSVNLYRKHERLCRHEMQDLEELGYHIDEVPEADRINQNYAAEEERAQGIDLQLLQRQHSLQKIQMVKRNIDHPRFKNIQSREAIALLKQSDIGQIYFRPSTRGPDHLNCTWKFFENVIVHLDIDEKGSRLQGANIGSKLWISDESFDNLQEIIERYITPCNRLLREALVHAKFLKCEKIENLETFLKKEKADEQSKIPYRLTLHDQYPQYLILGYIPKDTLVKEFIKVKPRGFFFHHNYFTSIPELFNWFKAQFRSAEYQRYLRKVSAPKPATFVPQISKQSQFQDQEQNAKMLDAQRFQTSGGLEYGIDNPVTYESKQKVYGRGGFRGEPTPMGNQNQGRNSPQYGNSPNGSDDSKREHRGGNGGDRTFGRGKRGGGDRRDEARANMACWNCGSTSHFARECPEPKKDRGPKRFRDRSDSIERPGDKRQKFGDDFALGGNSFRGGQSSFRRKNMQTQDFDNFQYTQQQFQGQYMQNFEQQNQIIQQQLIAQASAAMQQPPRAPQQPPRLPQPGQQNN